MEFKEVIATRHSVRRYTAEKIERSVIDDIIEEAMTAPSSKNSRSSGFMIIEDPDTLTALSQMRESGSKPLDGAAAAIVVLGDSDKSDLWETNAAISTTYILLSAADKGLGACWIQVSGRPRSKTDPSLGTAEGYVRELLGIKDNMRVLCLVSLGYEE